MPSKQFEPTVVMVMPLGCNSSHCGCTVVVRDSGLVGFLKADEKSRLQSVVNKTQRCGYLATRFKTLDELRQELYKIVFVHPCRYNPQNVLHQLLPHPNNTGYNLRQREHNLTLSSDVNSYQAKFYF